MWNDVRDCCGVGRINESGEALLSWCALNSLAVSNKHLMFMISWCGSSKEVLDKAHPH